MSDPSVSPDPDKVRGLYPKYEVRKLNGKPVGPCFVLEASDPHAPAALRAYAMSCSDEYAPLSRDLQNMADAWESGDHQ